MKKTTLLFLCVFVMLLGLPLMAGAVDYGQTPAIPDFGPSQAFVKAGDLSVRIVAPQHQFRLAQNEELVLSGRAADRYGALDESELEWYSDLDGLLGTGRDVRLTSLSLGVHRITLAAGGLEASVELAVYAQAWTVLIYICGDNDLEPYAIADVNEMEQIGSDANVNIAIVLDRITGYDTSNGNWTDSRSFYVTKDTNTSTITSQYLGTWGELAMDDPASLEAFMKHGITTYPAARYALIIWDHGSGWSKKQTVFKGAASDFTSGYYTELEIWEVRAAMRSALDQLGLAKIDLLAYDACLMGMLEVGYEARNEANYFVASEETEPGDGYEYQRWLASLAANPTATGYQLGQYLVSAYYGRSYSTLSAADLSKTANLTAAVNNLAQALINALPAYKSKISTARNKTKKFYDPSYLDLYNFCANLQKQSVPAAVKTAAANVQTAIGSYIIARGGTATNSYGVSIWFPSTYNATLMSSYVNNSQFGYDNLWWDFLDTYF